jgi:hypothetical protein
MANVPTPRSFAQIISDMLDTFLSRSGFRSVKVGSPVLSILEAAAQSDVRSTQDQFEMVNAQNLDRATGSALDLIGADEAAPRIQESKATGTVTITDGTISKISSKIYSGQAAPIVGSTVIYVVDATSLPTTGNIYIGRGTTQYEGPIAYASKSNLGSYWQLNLSTPTAKFHNFGETVVLAQAGARTVAAGTIIQTPQANVSTAIQFATLFAATIPDGETSVSGVQVMAVKGGVSGKVTAGAISAFVTAPFTGATVTNPLPFTNARATESDTDYRARLKNVRQSRAKGTDLAITTSLVGVQASDENKRILSASVVRKKGETTTVYLDDGTGYEEVSSGVALETVTDSATGGEQFFELAQRPITKAYAATTLSQPYALASGQILAVKVGGLTYKHTFDSSQFTVISSASAYEVTASINADSSLPFSARTIGSGTGVALFAKEDGNEDIEVTAVSAGESDANTVLGFPAGRADTLRFYRNDLLLSKDGALALVTSNPQSSWQPMSSPQTLIVEIDGTASATYTFTDSDFISQRTGFSTLATTNSLAAWATVFNSKVPGITATPSGGRLAITSNAGRVSRAHIKITGGTLLSTGRMFSFNTASALEAAGSTNDYQLSRNTSQIKLSVPLAAGDRLSVGSQFTRAFIQSTTISPITLSSTAELWFVVDGEAQVVSTAVTPGTIVNVAEYVTSPGVSWGHRVRVTATSGTPFTGIQVGDWAIFLDSNFNSGDRGAWRVEYVDVGNTYFEIARSAVSAQSGVTLSGGGIAFVRSNAELQKVSVSAASNYTAATFVDAINATLKGATAEVYRTTQYRVRTNTYASNGNIALVAANSEGAKLGLSTGSAITNNTSHLASVESSNSEAGTPSFTFTTVNTVTNGTTFTATSVTNFNPDSTLVVTRSKPDIDSSVARSRFGTNSLFRTNLDSISGSTLTTRRSALTEWLPADIIYPAAPFAISPQDDLSVVIDQDTNTKRYGINMYRKIKPTTSSYSTTNLFTDTDNSGQSLAVGFGLNFNYVDFAVHMKARAKSHAESGDTTSSILWRYNRFGPDGNRAKVKYTYPLGAGKAISVDQDASADGFVNINVRLPSGAARTGTTIRNSSKIGVMAASGAGGLQTLTYLLGYSISSASRVIKLAYTGRAHGTAVSGTITGNSSGATATATDLTPTSGVTMTINGTLSLTSVTGTFVDGEALKVSGVTVATARGSQYGETTLTLDVATPGAADHGFSGPRLKYKGEIFTMTATEGAIGQTNGASGTLTAVTDNGSTGILFFKDVQGNFADNETILTTLGGGAVADGTLISGDSIWIQSTDSNFSSGPKNITARTATTISYREGTTAVSSTPSIGTVSYDVAGQVTLSGSTAVSGDLFNIGAATSVLSGYQGSFKTASLANQYWTAKAETSLSTGTTPTWYAVNDSTAISFFPIDTSSNQAGQIATAVNALAAAANSTCPVTAVAVGTGGVTTGTVTKSSYDEYPSVGTGAGYGYTLTDGVNWVRSQTAPLSTANNYTFVFKAAVSSGLASNSDWANEECRLVPITARNLADYLGSTAVSGLSSVADVAVSQEFGRVQLTSLMAGSSGAVQIQGGLANSSAAVVRSAGSSVASTYLLTTSDTNSCSGLMGGMWARLQNTNAMPKNTFASGTVIATIDTVGNFTLDGSSSTNAWNWATTTPGVVSGFPWQVVANEGFISFQWTGVGSTPSLAGVSEGDWVTVSVGSGTISSGNTGTFRIVRIDNTAKAFWVENSNAIPEVGTCDLWFLTYDSILPGDVVSIGSSIWGAGNQKDWVVSSIDSGNQLTFKVSGSTSTFSVVTALGSAAPLVRCIEGAPTSLIKQIRCINTNSSNLSYVDVKFETAAGYRQVGPVAGTSIIALDKLGFPTSLALGIDGYRYNTGLIGEANKVLYGDPSDTATYPGVVATEVNISGPLTKRIEVALSIRTKSGASTQDVSSRVKSAVAAIINAAGVGEAISISDIVSAAQSVNGVQAVTILSPTYSVGNDLISVQPYEKPLVGNIDQDITVSTVAG